MRVVTGCSSIQIHIKIDLQFVYIIVYIEHPYALGITTLTAFK